MTAYATVADALALYGSNYVITSKDDDGDGTLDTTSFELFLSAATDKINSYLAGRVPLPLEIVTGDIKKYTIDIAIFECCPSAAEATEQKTGRYKMAMDWLQKFADNKVKVADQDGTNVGLSKTRRAVLVNSTEQESSLSTGSRDYTRAKLRGL